MHLKTKNGVNKVLNSFSYSTHGNSECMKLRQFSKYVSYEQSGKTGFKIVVTSYSIRQNLLPHS